MFEMILSAETLPEPLFSLVRTEKVRVHEAGGVIRLIPIADSDNSCPLRGLAADSDLTVDKFLAMTHDEFISSKKWRKPKRL